MADAVPHKPPVGGSAPENNGTPPAGAIPPVAAPVPPVLSVPPATSAAPANDTAKTPSPPPAAPPNNPPPPKPGAAPPPKNLFQKVKTAVAKPVVAAKQAIAQRIEEERQNTNTKKKIFERGVTMAGFGGVLEAAKTPKHKARAILTAIGHKIADMVAGSLVSNSFRLIAITLVAGMIGGVSSWGAIGLLALATGVSSAVYTYGKGYLGDRFTGPKDKRAGVKFFDRPRAINAGRAFLSGAANGAFGAWLAKLPLFQHVMHFIRDRVHAGVKSVTPDFNSVAAPLSLAPVPAPAPSKLAVFGKTLSAPFKAAARGISDLAHPGPVSPKPPLPGCKPA